MYKTFDQVFNDPEVLSVGILDNDVDKYSTNPPKGVDPTLGKGMKGMTKDGKRVLIAGVTKTLFKVFVDHGVSVAIHEHGADYVRYMSSHTDFGVYWNLVIQNAAIRKNAPVISRSTLKKVGYVGAVGLAVCVVGATIHHYKKN